MPEGGCRRNDPSKGAEGRENSGRSGPGNGRRKQLQAGTMSVTAAEPPGALSSMKIPAFARVPRLSLAQFFCIDYPHPRIRSIKRSRQQSIAETHYKPAHRPARPNLISPCGGLAARGRSSDPEQIPAHLCDQLGSPGGTGGYRLPEKARTRSRWAANAGQQ